MRDIILVLIVITLAFGAGLAFYFLPTNQGNTLHIEGASVLFRTIAQDILGGYTERRNFLIVNDDELRALWKEQFFDEIGAPPLPVIDFENSDVIAVFQGEKPTTGYGITVDKITDTAEGRVVSIVLSEPKQGCFTAQTMSAPYHIIVVPKSDKQLIRYEKLIYTCSNSY